MRVLGAALLMLALFPSAAGAWTAPRTIGTMRYGGEIGLAFNARGDAILTTHNDTRGFTSVRPAGDRFGAPRAFRTKFTSDRPRTVLGMDRSALLIGSWYHQARSSRTPSRATSAATGSSPSRSHGTGAPGRRRC